MKLAITAFAFLCMIGAAVAQQQLTVADILTKGGKKLSAVEVQQLYSGATVAGVQAGKPNITFNNQYHPDGTVTGESWNNGVSQGKLSGSWSVNAAGQACNNLLNGAVNSCLYYFAFSGKFYAALNEVPSTIVVERQISR